MKAFIITSMIISMIRTHKFTCVLSATNRANRCASCTMDTMKIRSLSSRPFHCSKAILLPASSGFLTANQKERRLSSGYEIVWKTTVQKRKLDECLSVDRCVSELIKLINPYLDSLDLSVFCDKVCFFVTKFTCKLFKLQPTNKKLSCQQPVPNKLNAKPIKLSLV